MKATYRSGGDRLSALIEVVTMSEEASKVRGAGIVDLAGDTSNNNDDVAAGHMICSSPSSFQ